MPTFLKDCQETFLFLNQEIL